MTVDEVRARLDQLTVAHAVATPGPWSAERNFADGWSLARARIEDADGTPVHGPSGWTAADAALIVAAVNHLPELLRIARGALNLADELEASYPRIPLQRADYIAVRLRAVITGDSEDGQR